MTETPAGDPATLDLETLEEMADVLGAEKFAKRLEAFREELGGLKPGLETMRAAGDVDGLAKFAHKLAGGAAIFGAQGLQAALAAIESTARRGEADRLPALIEAANRLGALSERDLSAWKQRAFG